SKPAQHSIQELRRIGLQPDLIVARCREPLDTEVRNKIALFGSVDKQAVFTSPNVDNIYELPMILDKQGLGSYLCKRMGIPQIDLNWERWEHIMRG
ncbi:MAG: CTP synthetase, partial [Candidatus Bathyarchaeia archaeon]